MNEPNSRLLRELDLRITSAKSQVDQDCLLAERACYLARRGFLTDADNTVRILRARYAHAPLDIVLARINLAEGLIHHFRDMSDQAREKFLRAHALSEVSENGPLIALSAAWLAHLDYLQGDVVAMTKHLDRALQHATPENHSAMSRATLVVADAYHLAARLDLALRWYAASRVHAAAEGDDATLSAYMHNMAWLRAANLRQNQFCSRPQSPDGAYALMSANSVFNFDQHLGEVSLQSLVPILRAQILSLTGQFVEALDLYEEHLSHALQEGLQRMHSNLLADKAWCKLQVGDKEGALADAAVAKSLITPNTHCDDTASTHSRLSHLYAEVGDAVSAKEHSESAAKAWQFHSALQESIVQHLATLSFPIVP